MEPSLFISNPVISTMWSTDQVRPRATKKIIPKAEMFNASLSSRFQGLDEEMPQTMDAAFLNRSMNG